MAVLQAPSSGQRGRVLSMGARRVSLAAESPGMLRTDWATVHATVLQ